MCLYPKNLGDGVQVSCRKCWQCRSWRLDNYLGRSLAEARVSTLSLATTLTYKTDHPHSQYLVYSDIQKMLKRLRFDGYKVRYIVAGEYGSAKGRAHWHCVLFLNGTKPLSDSSGNAIKYGARTDWPYWPHGHSFFQSPDYRGFRYILKYIFKDQYSESSQGHFGLSKKPVLGYQYFLQLADLYGKQGHLPPSPFYDMQERTFPLVGRARSAFLEAYSVAHWSHHGTYASDFPEWVHEELDKDVWKWRGYFDPETQGLDEEFIYEPLPQPLDGKPFHGPIRRSVRPADRNKLADTLFSFKAYSPNSIHRSLVYQQDTRILALQAGESGLHDAKAACGCASCRIRRGEEAERHRRVPTPF